MSLNFEIVKFRRGKIMSYKAFRSAFGSNLTWFEPFKVWIWNLSSRKCKVRLFEEMIHHLENYYCHFIFEVTTFLSKITTFIFFQTRRVPLIRFWILLRNDKFISTFWIKATFSAVALKNAPFKGRYRCQEFRRSLRKVICSIERNAFGNVHKWRVTFFGHCWPTSLPHTV